MLCFSPPSLATPYFSHTAMSASKPSTFLLFLFSFRTFAHRNPHRQLDNGPAAPVYAHAGLAYGPPITPAKPFNNGAGFRIGGPPEIAVRTTDQPEIALTQNPAYEARNFDLPFLRNFKAQPRFTGTRMTQWIRVAGGEHSMKMRIRLLVEFRRMRIG